MGMRLNDKVAMVVGAGQTPGPTMGNGRATALLFAREGARVLAVDRDLTSAKETVGLIREAGGVAEAVRADVLDEASLAAAVQGCVDRWERLDVLHNNVGISVAGGRHLPHRDHKRGFRSGHGREPAGRRAGL